MTRSILFLSINQLFSTPWYIGWVDDEAKLG